MIAICYLTTSTQDPDKVGDVHCKKFDFKLELHASIVIPLTTKYYPIGFSLTLDTFGNMFVTSEISHDNSTKLALYRYNKNLLVESYDLGQVNTNGREILLQRPLLDNREFCFVTARKFHVNKILKCIHV